MSAAIFLAGSMLLKSGRLSWTIEPAKKPDYGEHIRITFSTPRRAIAVRVGEDLFSLTVAQVRFGDDVAYLVITGVVNKQQVEVWRVSYGHIAHILDETAIRAKFLPGRQPRINLLMQGVNPMPDSSAWITYAVSAKGLKQVPYMWEPFNPVGTWKSRFGAREERLFSASEFVARETRAAVEEMNLKPWSISIKPDHTYSLRGEQGLWSVVGQRLFLTALKQGGKAVKGRKREAFAIGASHGMFYRYLSEYVWLEFEPS